MCWILSAAVSWRDLSHENNIFSPLDFCAELQHSYNCSPLWADILKPNFREFLSPPFDKFKFKILLEYWEKKLSNLFFSVMFWDGLWLTFIEKFIASFCPCLKDRSSIKLENIFWNITHSNSILILRRCGLIPNVLPMKIWKILQLTKSDKGNRPKVQLNQVL